MRFLHAADIHLGYRQYGSDERYYDFAQAFSHLVDDALAHKVSFLLVAGDLFHRHSIYPRTLLQATANLRRLRDAGIPVIAIEGNHERPRQSDSFSWLDYMASAGLLILLNPRYEKGEMILDPWNEDDRRGAYVDLPGGIRIIGVKYYGASTPRVIQDLTHALDSLYSAMACAAGPRPAYTLGKSRGYTILILHAGLHGILDRLPATLTRLQLEPLRSRVDYLAMGHIHKPFVLDDWIYNPGSTETVSVDEVAWEDRGYLLVEVGPSVPATHTVTKLRSHRRAFVRLSFSVDPYHTPESLYRAFQEHLQPEATSQVIGRSPVVELRLRGVLAFDRADLDADLIEGMVRKAFQPIVCLVRDVTALHEFEVVTNESMTRADLERQVVQELVERDVRRRATSEQWTNMILSVKRLALDDCAPQEIVAALQASGILDAEASLASGTTAVGEAQSC